MARTSSVHLHKPYHTIRINMRGVYGYVRGHTLVLTAASFHPNFDPRSTEPGWVVGADAPLVGGFGNSDLRLDEKRWLANPFDEIDAVLILERNPMVMQRIKLVMSTSKHPDRLELKREWVAYPAEMEIPKDEHRPSTPWSKDYSFQQIEDPDEAAVKILERYFWSVLDDLTEPTLYDKLDPHHVLSEFMAGRHPLADTPYWMDRLSSITQDVRCYAHPWMWKELKCMLFDLKVEDKAFDPKDLPVFKLTKGLAELAIEAVERMLAPSVPAPTTTSPSRTAPLRPVSQIRM
jgi:hypothetical protein